MTRKRRRLWLVLVCGAALATAVTLILMAFQDNLVFFVTPSELAKTATNGRVVRLGGLVEQGSVRHGVDGGAGTLFRVTDGKHDVAVRFDGVLPGLFREGQGVVVLGKLHPGGTFVASEVLAKHDANYMPKAVADALKKSGHWNPATGGPPPGAIWDATLGKSQATTPGQTPGTARAGTESPAAKAGG
jgi:cytochrome c-type biogenesis protein CcmE